MALMELITNSMTMMLQQRAPYHTDGMEAVQMDGWTHMMALPVMYVFTKVRISQSIRT